MRHGTRRTPALGTDLLIRYVSAHLPTRRRRHVMESTTRLLRERMQKVALGHALWCLHQPLHPTPKGIEMNKGELVEHVANETGSDKAAAGRALDAVLQGI